jgi:ABC-type polysaccharide/polyol phosphate transport system ATPase subunit
MNQKPSIQIENLGISFRLPTEQIRSTKDFFILATQRKIQINTFWALRHVTFNLEQGGSLGVMGRNGAGKSTLLKAIARVLTPKEGRVVIRGKVFPMLELGAGFVMDLTGHENIYLYGNILGLSNQLITELYDSIVDFSELGDFIHAPLRSYSSGMVARLAFATATAVQPDILLADEILSVGDKNFQDKCMERMTNYLNNGTTIVFVSHSAESVKKICKQGLWLDGGTIKMTGSAEEVAEAYAAS